MWGSPEEKERKLRIDVAAMAYAYEIENDPIATDAQFDQACLAVNPLQPTGNKRLDAFFQQNFHPHTGLWVHQHPDKAGLKRVCAIKRTAHKMSETFSQDKCKELASRILHDLNDHTAKIYDDGHRWHLGASQIGESCARKLWYGFRWVMKPDFVNAHGENHKGRMMRLFNRGHKEEVRFVEWLRGMGFIVDEFQPDGKTQFRIKDVNGHYGGSLDGMVTLPTSYGAYPKMLLEFKTSSDKYFGKLTDDGVRKAKPQHYAQMCSYGKRYELKYALYMCVNKNTDDIYIEIVELDWSFADLLTNRAADIINAPTPPAKMNENSAYFECKFCDFHSVCHLNKPYEKNCRSCAFSAPAEDGQWACNLHGGIIPRDFVPKGCDSWKENR